MHLELDSSQTNLIRNESITMSSVSELILPCTRPARPREGVKSEESRWKKCWSQPCSALFTSAPCSLGWAKITAAHAHVYIFLFFSFSMQFFKFFPTSAVQCWDIILVPPPWTHFRGNFTAVSSTFLRIWCGADYLEIFGSCLRQEWSRLSQPTWEVQISLFLVFRVQDILRYTNAW